MSCWSWDMTAEERMAPRSWDSSMEPTMLTTRRIRYRKRAIVDGSSVEEQDGRAGQACRIGAQNRTGTQDWRAGWMNETNVQDR